MKSVFILLLFLPLIVSAQRFREKPEKDLSQTIMIRDTPEIDFDSKWRSAKNEMIGGKIFQAIGVGCLSAALYVSVAEIDDQYSLSQVQSILDKRQSAITTLSLIGGFSFGVGLIMDFNGNIKMLRLQRK